MQKGDVSLVFFIIDKASMDYTEILFGVSLLLVVATLITLIFYGRQWRTDISHVSSRLQQIEDELGDRAETCPLRLQMIAGQSLTPSATEEKPTDIEQIRRYVHLHFPTLIEEISAYASEKLSPSEELLCMMIKLGYTNKEISSILSITASSVITARYRLKRKLALPPGRQLDSWIADKDK